MAHSRLHAALMVGLCGGGALLGATASAQTGPVARGATEDVASAAPTRASGRTTPEGSTREALERAATVVQQTQADIDRQLSKLRGRPPLWLGRSPQDEAVERARLVAELEEVNARRAALERHLSTSAPTSASPPAPPKPIAPRKAQPAKPLPPAASKREPAMASTPPPPAPAQTSSVMERLAPPPGAALEPGLAKQPPPSAVARKAQPKHAPQPPAASTQPAEPSQHLPPAVQPPAERTGPSDGPAAQTLQSGLDASPPNVRVEVQALAARAREIESRMSELDAAPADSSKVEERLDALAAFIGDLRKVIDTRLARGGSEPPESTGPDRAGEKPRPDGEPKRVGVNVDLEVASIYSWRGLNVFKSSSQNDQHAVLSPSVTWKIFETGVSVGYLGAYQWTGDNRAANVDAGIGHEQDVLVAWSGQHGRFGYGAGVTYIFYPFADAKAAGTDVPSVLEPGVCASFSTVVDLSMVVLYSAGIQEALAAARYLYVQPKVAKTIAITPATGVLVGVSAGYKVFADSEITDNRADVRGDLEVSSQVGAGFYVRPGLHVAWTNLADAGPGDEYSIWAGLHGGADL